MKDKNMLFKSAAALAVLSGSLVAAAAEKTWSNKSGDWDLGNVANWGGAYPSVAADTAIIDAATTTEAPYVLSSTNLLESYWVCLGKRYGTTNGAMTLDLGADGELYAAQKFFIETFNTVTLKSGTVGVTWDGSSSERFFLGDTNKGSGKVDDPTTVVVDGPTAKFVTSKKSNLQVGTNRSNVELRVVNGGTIEGNVLLGNNAVATNNLAVIDGTGSKQVVPSGGTVSPLTVGALGFYSRYVLQNGASFTCEEIPGGSDPYVIVGHQGCFNKLSVTDHSTFDTVTDLIVGNLKYDGSSVPINTSSNEVVVSGGSTLTCGKLNINYGKSTGGRMSVLDGATVTPSGTLTVGSSAFSRAAELVVSDAVVDVSKAGLTLGGHALTADNHLLIEDGGSLVLTNTTLNYVYLGSSGTNNLTEVRGGSMVLSNVLFYVGSAGNAVSNRFVLSNGVLALTNDLSIAASVAIGKSGSGNEMVVENGSRVEWNDSYAGNSREMFAVGYDATAVGNTLVISNKASWVQRDYATGTAGGFYVGYKGANSGLLIDDATLDVGSDARNGLIIDVANDTSASNCWMTVRNGAQVQTHRIIFGIKGKNSKLTVDDATCNFGQFQFGDLAESGTQFTISGDKTKITASSLALAPGMTMTYKIDRRGLRTDEPVLSVVNGNVAPTSKVSSEDPVTIKIDTDSRAKGGTYTLLKVSGSGKSINWTNVNLEYDAAAIKSVTKTSTELTVTVRDRGLVLFVR